MGGTCDHVMGHHRALTSMRVAHMERATTGSVGCVRGVRLLDKRGIKSHKSEGRRIAAHGGGWWCLELNWRRVVAMCLRAGGLFAALDWRRLAVFLPQ